jgi:hypothetical protein
MRHGIVKSVLLNQYHRAAYKAFAKAGGILTAWYIVTPSQNIAGLQRQATIKAHYHRVRAEKAIE